ncbi:MAG: 50S ribosomal protein L22 [Chloroflexi bacterium]|nr:50S ribosomal protein L22 [Chloroflexota bacterium]
MEVKATARAVRVSPRKVRLVLNTIRGKSVEDALTILRYLPQPSARDVAKVVKSAAANAENNYQMSADLLRVIKVFADEGVMLKRFKARSRGRASPRLTRYSHITVVVEEV